MEINQYPLISVIIPVYNSEKFLDRSLGSIISQTLKDIEIICIDDASSDCSYTKLKSFGEQDDRITIIRHNENKGAAISRNDGLKIAKGTYVIFLDSDDYFYEDMLEKAYVQAEEKQADVCIVGSEQMELSDECIKKFYPIVNSTKEMSKLIDTDYQRGLLIYEIRHVPWDKLVRRELLTENHIIFQDLPANNDIFYSFSIIGVAKRIVLCNEILIRYYWGRKGSLTELRTHKKNYMVDAFFEVYLFFIQKKINSMIVNAFLNVMLDNIQRYLSDCNVAEALKMPVEAKLSECMVQINEFRQTGMDENDILHPHNRVFLENVIKQNDVYHIEYMDYYGEAIKRIVQSEKKREKRVALWGCGERGCLLLDLLTEIEVKLDYVIDQKRGKRGEFYKGYPIYLYEEIENNIDVILITNFRFKDEIRCIAKNKQIIYVWK